MTRARILSDYVSSGDELALKAPITNAALVTPNLGTPSAGVMTNMTGAVTASLVDNAVTLAKMAGGTDGNLITYDTSGDPAYVATGTSGHVLTSAGADAVPTFQAAAAGGANTPAFRAHHSANQSIASGLGIEIVTGTEGLDSAGTYSTVTGRWTPGTAGWYFIYFGYRLQSGETATRMTAMLYKGGSIITSQETEDSKHQSDGYQGINLSSLVVLTDSEYVSPFLYHNKGSAADVYDINFFGYRIPQ